MKKIKLNSNRLLAILLSGFILVNVSGCGNKKNETNKYNHNDSYTVENEKEISTSTDKVETDSNIGATTNHNYSDVSTEVPKEDVDTTDIQTNSPETESIKEKELTKEDKEVLSYFEEIKTSVKEVSNSTATEEVKDKLKGTFITIVDFVFYDGEVKGIKFDDLTDGAKQNVLETATIIDNMIMTKFPNYKESISDKASSAYNKASELIKSGANNIREFSKEKLGEDNYNAIIEVKDELFKYTKEAASIIGEFAGSILEKGKTNVKKWYESFKNN